MEISTLLTIAGLVLDIIGGVLLFLFGFPTKIDFGGLDQSKEPPSIQTHPIAKIGLGLLIAGFAFQLLGTVCTP
jgi:hypothetical protein